MRFQFRPLCLCPVPACRAADVAEEAARLGYCVGEGDRGEAMVYR